LRRETAFFVVRQTPATTTGHCQRPPELVPMALDAERFPVEAEPIFYKSIILYQ
jgi:hypothetical protein